MAQYLDGPISWCFLLEETAHAQLGHHTRNSWKAWKNSVRWKKCQGMLFASAVSSFLIFFTVLGMYTLHICALKQSLQYKNDNTSWHKLHTLLNIMLGQQKTLFFYQNIYNNVQTNNLQSTKINQNKMIKMSQMINITLQPMQ